MACTQLNNHMASERCHPGDVSARCSAAVDPFMPCAPPTYSLSHRDNKKWGLPYTPQGVCHERPVWRGALPGMSLGAEGARSRIPGDSAAPAMHANAYWAPCRRHWTTVGCAAGLHGGQPPPPPTHTLAPAGRTSHRVDVDVDRGPRRRPLLASSGHGRVQIQANCGVWLTARRRGHRDTQPQTHKRCRGGTYPGAPQHVIQETHRAQDGRRGETHRRN